MLPSNDWVEISPFHTYAAVLRGIENGVSVIRPVSGALSMISDPYGRVVATNEFINQSERVVVGEIATSSPQAIYPYLGDFFAWICIIGFMLIWLERLRFLLLKKRK